ILAIVLNAMDMLIRQSCFRGSLQDGWWQELPRLDFDKTKRLREILDLLLEGVYASRDRYNKDQKPGGESEPKVNFSNSFFYCHEHGFIQNRYAMLNTAFLGFCGLIVE